MAWAEWEQLKAEAQERGQRNRMQLNGTPGGDGSDDLRTNHVGKQLAVKALRNDIRPATSRAGRYAQESSETAVRELNGWETGSGLNDVQRHWKSQVESLRARLARDQSALELTKREFQNVDRVVEGGIAHIATIFGARGDE
ncbi:hypothetical protein [Streptomyces lasiicapitis]|uniref:hypothetical protein n=1 Tax=Streptomyces lasiicapitis TaxID=1923961 RepID=UPI0036557A2B